MPCSWTRPGCTGLNVRYAVRVALTLHAGVRNLTAERPFATDAAFPTSARGRMFYLRAAYRLR